MRKNYQGILTISDNGKIHFNDAKGCRLRICGFNKQQKFKLREAEFIDITFIPDRFPVELKTAKSVIQII